MAKSSLSRHLLNLKVLPTSKILKLYMPLSSTSMTNSFAPTFKQKLDGWMMMNCDNHLRRFNKILTHWHWMSSVKEIHAFVANDSAWHVQSIKYEPWFFSKKLRLSRDAYLNRCVRTREITVLKVYLICKCPLRDMQDLQHMCQTHFPKWVRWLIHQVSTHCVLYDVHIIMPLEVQQS